MLGIAFSQLNKALRLPPFSLLLVALAIVDGTYLGIWTPNYPECGAHDKISHQG
jgi:hypothetical protein